MKWNSQFFSLKCCSLKYQTFYFTYIFWAYWLNEFSLTVNACACDARVIMNANTYISFGNDFSIIQPLNLTVCDRCSRHLLNNHSHGLGLVHTNPQYHRNPLWLVFHDIHNDQRRMRSPSLLPIHSSNFLDMEIQSINSFFYSFVENLWNSIGMLLMRKCKMWNCYTYIVCDMLEKSTHNKHLLVIMFFVFATFNTSNAIANCQAEG